MSKDLQGWGRDKARARYESGGVIKPPTEMDAARAELGRRMRDKETFKMPDNQGSLRLPYVPKDEDAYQEGIKRARSGFANIKRGGRIK